MYVKQAEKTLLPHRKHKNTFILVSQERNYFNNPVEEFWSKSGSFFITKFQKASSNAVNIHEEPYERFVRV